MPDPNNIQEIIQKQKIALAELEKEADIILKSNFSFENEVLKQELDKLKLKIEDLNKTLKTFSHQNTSLKNSLYEQIYSEKLQILNYSQKKIDILFKSQISGQINDLNQLEINLKTKINYLINELRKNSVDSSNEIFKKLDNLSLEVCELVKESKENFLKEGSRLSDDYKEKFEKLKSERITDDTIVSLSKKNNIEDFVGSNLINKLGILFIILGIIAISRYTVPLLTDIFKGILMFIISAVFLVFGEFLNRKKSSIFSIGITSGGVASFYVSLSISYFGLHIISMYPALLLCILITTGAFVLSQRYNSETIAVFALIGGYIPIVSISQSLALTYSSMIYFVVLNLLALSISFYKKWKVTMFIGYFLNLLGTIYIVFQMIDNRVNNTFSFHELSTIVYIVFAFAIYTLIPVLSNYREKHPFTKSDIIILALNTVISGFIMYYVFYMFDISRFNGIMAIGFALTYISLSRFIETHFNNEKHTIALFYLTALTFTVLIIPFQFGKQWLSIGWLIQSCVLTVYGILTGEKKFKNSGFVIFGLCIGSFLFFDFMLEIDDFFAYKYFAITLGSIFILGAFIYENGLSSVFKDIYKYCAIVNLYIYILYVLSLSDNYIFKIFIDHEYILYFVLLGIKLMYTFIFAYFLPNIKVIADKGIKLISIVLSILAMFALGVFTVYVLYANNYTSNLPLSTTIITTILLILLSAQALLAMYNVLMYFIVLFNISVEWLPFGISLYFLFIVSQNIIVQYGMHQSRIVVSIIYVIAALAWIIYGFMKRYAFMRRFGLVLSVLSVAKLFLFDLPDLTQGYKIISYFAFAIALLSISFVYQYFGKSVVLKGELKNNVEDDK